MEPHEIRIGQLVYARSHDAFGNVLEIRESGPFVRFSEMFNPPLEEEVPFSKLMSEDDAYALNGR